MYLNHHDVASERLETSLVLYSSLVIRISYVNNIIRTYLALVIGHSAGYGILGALNRYSTCHGIRYNILGI